MNQNTEKEYLNLANKINKKFEEGDDFLTNKPNNDMITFWSNNKNPPHPFSIYWRMGPGEDEVTNVYKTHPNLNNPNCDKIDEFQDEDERTEFLDYFSKKYNVLNTGKYEEMYQMANNKYVVNRTEYGRELAKSNPPIYWLIRCYELIFEHENSEFYGYDQCRNIVKENWNNMIDLGFPPFPDYNDTDYLDI